MQAEIVLKALNPHDREREFVAVTIQEEYLPLRMFYEGQP